MATEAAGGANASDATVQTGPPATDEQVDAIRRQEAEEARARVEKLEAKLEAVKEALAEARKEAKRVSG